MRTSDVDMADSVDPADIDTFIDNPAWAIRSTYHTVLKASECNGCDARELRLIGQRPFSSGHLVLLRS
jgi:hypothetical protein